MARAEITGRKPINSIDPRGPPLALSIRQFCALHSISADMFFKMRREGWAPAVMKVGTRTLISFESAEAWRRAREQAATAETTAA